MLLVLPLILRVRCRWEPRVLDVAMREDEEATEISCSAWGCVVTISAAASTAAPAAEAWPKEAPSNKTSSEGEDVESQPGPASGASTDASGPEALKHGGDPLPMKGISIEALVQIAERVQRCFSAEQAEAMSTSDVCQSLVEPAEFLRRGLLW